MELDFVHLVIIDDFGILVKSMVNTSCLVIRMTISKYSDPSVFTLV